MDRIVVVGACAAGLAAAQTLREEGYAGHLLLLDGERHCGYDRPPLSKQILAGAMSVEAIALRPPDFFSAHRIDHRVNVRARSMNAVEKTVHLDTDECVTFDGMVIATGLRPRRLPGQPRLRGLHTLRTVDDALALRADLEAGSRVVIVGAGFLGGEIAATARGLGLEVCLVEPMTHPMARQLGGQLAGAVMDLHRSQGVDVRSGRSVAGFEEREGQVSAVLLDDTTRLACDVVVVAIGSLPNIEWVAGSGVPLDDGIVCDAYCRAIPSIYAAGDVARWPHPGTGALMRLEHRQNATEQGIASARNLLGAQQPYRPLPYFWTDLYGIKIQVFGHIDVASDLIPLSGTLGQRGFTALSAAKGVVGAVIGWSAAKQVRRLSTAVGQAVSVARLSASIAA